MAWFYLSYGLVLGLSAGFSPGPLQVIVITQTLRYGAAEGFKVAAAPLITDLPIIGLAFLLLFSMPDMDLVLGLVAYAGAAFLLWLGIDSWRAKPVEYEDSPTLPRSYLRGALVNALSPHPYLFWVLLGVPTLIKASQTSISTAALFLISFFTCLVGAKMFIAYLTGRSRQFLTGLAYRWVMRLLGVFLIIFALLLVKDGVTFSGISQT